MCGHYTHNFLFPWYFDMPRSFGITILKLCFDWCVFRLINSQLSVIKHDFFLLFQFILKKIQPNIVLVYTVNVYPHFTLISNVHRKDLRQQSIRDYSRRLEGLAEKSLRVCGNERGIVGVHSFSQTVFENESHSAGRPFWNWTNNKDPQRTFWISRI